MPTPLSDSDKVLRNDTGKDMVSQLTAIAQALGVGVDADQINYDNTESGLTVDNAQEAIDEIKDITDDLDEKIDNKTSYESTASGSIATFSDGGDNIPMKSCEVAIVAQRAGSGTPSPSNPRAITGFSSVNVVDCGVNLWNEDWEQGLYNNQGVKVPNTTGIRAKNLIPVKPSMSYRVIGISGANRVCYYDVNGTFISTETGVSTGTTPNNCYFMTFSTSTTYGGSYRNDISINYPSTDTVYHKGTGTTTPVSLGQTIYGGTAEIVGGNGIKTHGYVDLSTLSWTSTSQNRRVATLSGVKEVTTGLPPIIAEKYETFSNNDLYYNNKTGIATYNNQVIVRNNPTTDTPTGLAVFELQTPTAFTFTGASIPTLSGVNNIYADSGDVDLEYFNENADEIADLIRAFTR